MWVSRSCVKYTLSTGGSSRWPDRRGEVSRAFGGKAAPIDRRVVVQEVAEEEQRRHDRLTRAQRADGRVSMHAEQRFSFIPVAGLRGAGGEPQQAGQDRDPGTGASSGPALGIVAKHVADGGGACARNHETSRRQRRGMASAREPLNGCWAVSPPVPRTRRFRVQ